VVKQLKDKIVKIIEKMSMISPGTWGRLSSSAVVFINLVLNELGINPLPFGSDDVYTALSFLAAGIAFAWAIWKNNSITEAAIEADKVLAEYKKEGNNAEKVSDTSAKGL